MIATRTAGPGRMLGPLRALMARKREIFWVWIAYQTVKGCLTTAIVWLPLLAYLRG